jgi:hypothetical protein
MIALITSSRFGGRLLESTFEQVVPNALPLGEIFRKNSRLSKRAELTLERYSDGLSIRLREDPTAALEDLCDLDPNNDLLARIHYYHIDRTSPVWGRIASRTRIIHVIRRNLFDAYVSHRISTDHGVWRITNDASSTDLCGENSLSISPSEVSRYIENRKSDVEWCRVTFSGAQYQEVYFEDIVISAGVRSSLISQCIGKDILEDPISRSNQSSRIKTICNADLISNYGAVAHLDRQHF